MLVCFGLAWPTAIIKSLRTRSTKGKSVLFLIIVAIGYLAGITHKLLYSRDYVLYIYILNLCMVMFDLALYIRNVRLEKAQAKAA
jgi:hypothetical protein